jgi:hypothetical protein
MTGEKERIINKWFIKQDIIWFIAIVMISLGMCNHQRVKRLDNNFIRCLQCGQSMISQVETPINKTRAEFTQENKQFERNFHRNFSNQIEQTDLHEPAPLEYYTDKHNLNHVVIDRSPFYATNPPKYKVNFNGEDVVMTDEQINDVLERIKAMRINNNF